MFMYYVLLVLTLIGLWRMRGRLSRSEKWILFAPFILTLLVAVTTYGDARFRYEAEAMLMVFAAVTLEPLLGRRKPAALAAAP